MKAGNTLKLSGQNYINGLPEHHREAATKQLNVVLETADTFNAELAAIQDDDELSPEGRVVESAKVAASALAKLAAVNVPIKTLTERVVTLEKSLLAKVTYHAPKETAERIAHELQLQEIRGQLRGLSALERLNVYRSTTTGPLVRAAIETAPVGVLSALRPDGSRGRMEPFVDPEQMASVKMERAEQADPATANTLREVKALREVYSHAVNGVRKEILDEVPGAMEKREPVIV